MKHFVHVTEAIFWAKVSTFRVLKNLTASTNPLLETVSPKKLWMHQWIVSSISKFVVDFLDLLFIGSYLKITDCTILTIFQTELFLKLFETELGVVQQLATLATVFKSSVKTVNQMLTCNMCTTELLVHTDYGIVQDSEHILMLLQMYLSNWYFLVDH